MRELNVEWLHFETDGVTCDRCAGTGTTLKTVIDQLTRDMADEGIKVTLTETLLPATAMDRSNLLLFNGTPLENLLEEVEASTNHCASCSCLTGQDTDCRTIVYEGQTYEEIPAEVLYKAAMKALAS
jgi:hypothetical protein